MKWTLALIVAITILASCNNSGESGVQNDGDSATRKNSTIYPPADPATDTSIGEHRVDIQKRDSM
jgi:hypothetical protein